MPLDSKKNYLVLYRKKGKWRVYAQEEENPAWNAEVAEDVVIGLRGEYDEEDVLVCEPINVKLGVSIVG